MEHTKEPWEAYEVGNSRFIKSKAGDLIASGCTNMDDARRIVACVNACWGSPVEALEEMKQRNLTLGSLAYKHAQTKNQLDKLLAAADQCGHGGIAAEAWCPLCSAIAWIRREAKSDVPHVD